MQTDADNTSVSYTEGHCNNEICKGDKNDLQNLVLKL